MRKSKNRRVRKATNRSAYDEFGRFMGWTIFWLSFVLVALFVCCYLDTYTNTFRWLDRAQDRYVRKKMDEAHLKWLEREKQKRLENESTSSN